MTENDALRQRAEALARENAARSPERIEAMSPEQVKQALHELRVHQIELEMQNEELRRAQLELDAAQARYFDLYDLAPVGYCTLSEQGLILEANLTAATLLNVVRGALIKQPITRFILPENQDIYYLHRKQLFETGAPQTCELRMVKNDGTPFWAHLEAAAAQTADGAPTCRAMLSDITARKQVEEALRASEAKYRQLIESLNEGIWMIDEQAVTTFVNPRLAEMLGYTVEEMLGRHLFSFMDEQGVQLATLNLARRQQGIKEQHDFEFLRKDGARIYVGLGTAPVTDRDSAYRGAIAGVVDITDRKRLEQALELRARELSALNRASHAITSTLDLNVVLDLIIGEIKNLIDAQSASVLLYEPATDELIFSAGVGPHFAQLLHTRMSASAGIAGWVAREKRSALVGNAQLDPRFYAQIDQLIGHQTRDLLAAPLLAKGQLSGVIEAINKSHGAFDEHDLEILEGLAAAAAIAIENARLYQQEREQFERLQQTQAQMIHFEKMAALGRLIASIAHEINNPLQSVQGCISLALEELAGRRRYDKLTSYLDMTAGEIERITAILNRMRDFYRPATPEMQPVDVHGLLRSVLELVNKHLQRSQIAVAREWAADLPPIVANADHLKQVFLNLVLNAIDAMSTGGTLRVQTRPDHLTAPNGQRLPAARIDFTDTGEGIPPEALPHIFEPFFTAKKSGAGLGLSISYGIIEAHHGQITATSQVRQGATFTIVLPVEQP